MLKYAIAPLLAALSSFLVFSSVAGSGSNDSSVQPIASGQVLVVNRLCREENYNSISVLPKIHAAAADVMQIAALNINSTSNSEVVRIQGTVGIWPETLLPACKCQVWQTPGTRGIVVFSSFRF